MEFVAAACQPNDLPRESTSRSGDSHEWRLDKHFKRDPEGSSRKAQGVSPGNWRCAQKSALKGRHSLFRPFRAIIRYLL